MAAAPAEINNVKLQRIELAYVLRQIVWLVPDGCNDLEGMLLPFTSTNRRNGLRWEDYFYAAIS